MKANKADEIGGVIHLFSYTKEMHEKFLDMDLSRIGGGYVT